MKLRLAASACKDVERPQAGIADTHDHHLGTLIAFSTNVMNSTSPVSSYVLSNDLNFVTKSVESRHILIHIVDNCERIRDTIHIFETLFSTHAYS